MGAIVLLDVPCLRRATLGNAARSLLENTSDEKLNEVEERSLSVGGYAIAQTINSVKTTNKVSKPQTFKSQRKNKGFSHR
ncbi:MAG: hypothetical protein HWQ38_28160 [Nostoc sp. NMS7]|uniref:hypothetical protein n=1 Tax=Nostoc sp. NMS7 TaxID=2815391 RepID=UPI0025F37B38|nr:hypothetical protein [Nostoc sp. NMS7]MBN3950135.1 hypothetical protein [Nostoc sp. NMS7]